MKKWNTTPADLGKTTTTAPQVPTSDATATPSTTYSTTTMPGRRATATASTCANSCCAMPPRARKSTLPSADRQASRSRTTIPQPSSTPRCTTGSLPAKMRCLPPSTTYSAVWATLPAAAMPHSRITNARRRAPIPTPCVFGVPTERPTLPWKASKSIQKRAATR